MTGDDAAPHGPYRDQKPAVTQVPQIPSQPPEPTPRPGEFVRRLTQEEYRAFRRFPPTTHTISEVAGARAAWSAAMAKARRANLGNEQAQRAVENARPPGVRAAADGGSVALLDGTSLTVRHLVIAGGVGLGILMLLRGGGGDDGK